MKPLCLGASPFDFAQGAPSAVEGRCRISVPRSQRVLSPRAVSGLELNRLYMNRARSDADGQDAALTLSSKQTDPQVLGPDSHMGTFYDGLVVTAGDLVDVQVVD